MKINCFTFLLPLCAALVLGPACTPYVKQAQVDTTVKSQLTAEILEMDKKDQQYRWQLVFGETDLAVVDSLSKLPTAEKVKHFKKRGAPNNKLTEAQYDAIQRAQDSLDKANQDRILEIYRTYGWPGKELVGRGAGLVSIMMLHFPDSLKLALYPQLKKEYKRGHIAGSAVATMYDRYLLEQNQPLLYGMYKHFDSASKKDLPPMISDIEQTNKARKKLGLPPLEQYRLAGSKREE